MDTSWWWAFKGDWVFSFPIDSICKIRIQEMKVTRGIWWASVSQEDHELYLARKAIIRWPGVFILSQNIAKKVCCCWDGLDHRRISYHGRVSGGTSSRTVYWLTSGCQPSALFFSLADPACRLWIRPDGVLSWDAHTIFNGHTAEWRLLCAQLSAEPSYIFIYLFEVQLIYNVLFVSGV